MKHYFIQQKHLPRLTLFFAGWGMDECPFMDYCPENSDLLVCYDYRSLDFDFTLLQGYQAVSYTHLDVYKRQALHGRKSA